jgi:hypothetical protein
MKTKKRFCFLPQITMTLFIGLWPLAWPAHGEAAELSFTTQRGSELEHVRGPVRQMTVTTKDSIVTLRFSSNAVLTEKITRNRADSSHDPDEIIEYRYEEDGRKLGEYLAEPDGEVVPLRLHAYNDRRQLSAEAAYHMCRTFSSLHVYRSDERNRLVEDVQFESRRLTRWEFAYDSKGQVERVVMHRNGKLMAMTRYTYNDAGHVRTAISEQPDGSIVRRLYQYDDHGNVIVFIETHPRDSARDKTEITTYEYDQQGNWTRRTIVRAVNPLDGLPSEEPVEVAEREIVYGY